VCFNCQWPYISASHVRLDMPFICMFTNIVYLCHYIFNKYVVRVNSTEGRIDSLFDFGYTKDL